MLIHGFGKLLNDDSKRYPLDLLVNDSWQMCKLHAGCCDWINNRLLGGYPWIIISPIYVNALLACI